MEYEKKLKKLDQLLRGKGWEEVTKVLKSKRGNIVLEMIANPRGGEPTYGMDDLLKERIKMINFVLELPKRLITLYEEQKTTEQEENTEVEDNTSIGDVNDLYKQQDQ